MKYYLPFASLFLSFDLASLSPAEHSTLAGTQAPFISHCLSTKISMQLSSPGGHSLHVCPQVLPLQDPPDVAGFVPSSDAPSLDDDADDEDDEDDEESSSSLPEERFFGSSYSTGFIRGPHATTKQRAPTNGRASLRMLERFTGKLLDYRSVGEEFPMRRAERPIPRAIAGPQALFRVLPADGPFLRLVRGFFIRS